MRVHGCRSERTCMLKAVMTRVCTPLVSTAACKLIAFMTVASILRGRERKQPLASQGWVSFIFTA